MAAVYHWNSNMRKYFGGNILCGYPYPDRHYSQLLCLAYYITFITKQQDRHYLEETKLSI